MWYPNKHCDNPNVTDEMKRTCVILGTYVDNSHVNTITHTTYYITENSYLRKIKAHAMQEHYNDEPGCCDYIELLQWSVYVPFHLVSHFKELAEKEQLSSTYVIIHDDKDGLCKGDILVLEDRIKALDILHRLEKNQLLSIPQRFISQDILQTIALVNQSG